MSSWAARTASRGRTPPGGSGVDSLMSCSFASQDCVVALGDTPQQRFISAWSDGIVVAEPHFTDDPGPPTVPAATPVS